MAAVKGVVIRKAPRISEEQYREKLGLKRLTDFGSEKPDPVPMEPPVGFKKQPSIFENMRALVAAELARKAETEGFETEEEANNMDIPEERDPLSRHQFTEMEEEFVTTTARTHNEKVAQAKAPKAPTAAVEPAQAKEGQGPAKPASEALDAPKPAGKP